MPDAVDEEPNVWALLARIAAREEAALRDLHALMGARIVKFVLHQSHGDESLARSVMSETLWSIWKDPQGFRFESAFSTWVLGIARHRMLDELRAQRRRQHEDIDDHAQTLADESPDVLTRIDAQQRASALQACIEKLADAQRQCLHLVHFEGMNQSEVASVMGVPEGTIKSRLHHARANLKTCIARRLGENP